MPVKSLGYYGLCNNCGQYALMWSVRTKDCYRAYCKECRRQYLAAK